MGFLTIDENVCLIVMTGTIVMAMYTVGLAFYKASFITVDPYKDPNYLKTYKECPLLKLRSHECSDID